MEKTELTPEAKEAIRSFMLRVVALPGAVLGIVGFMLGFFINEVASNKAYNEAYTTASSAILSLTEKATDSAGSAKRAAQEVEYLLQNAKVVLSEAEIMRGQIKTALEFQQSEFQQSEDLVKATARAMLERPNIGASLIKAITNEIDTLRSEQARFVANADGKYVSFGSPIKLKGQNGYLFGWGGVAEKSVTLEGDPNHHLNKWRIEK